MPFTAGLVLHFKFQELDGQAYGGRKDLYHCCTERTCGSEAEKFIIAYHKAREAERYQNRVIRQIEMSLERFQEEGVSAEYRVVRAAPGIEEEMIRAEDNRRLYHALDELNVEERLLM